MYFKQLMIMSCFFTMVSTSAMLPQRIGRTIQKVANKTDGYKKLTSFQKRFCLERAHQDKTEITPFRVIASVPLGILTGYAGAHIGVDMGCMIGSMYKAAFEEADDNKVIDDIGLKYGALICGIGTGTCVSLVCGGIPGFALWSLSSLILYEKIVRENKELTIKEYLQQLDKKN